MSSRRIQSRILRLAGRTAFQRADSAARARRTESVSGAEEFVTEGLTTEGTPPFRAHSASVGQSHREVVAQQRSFALTIDTQTEATRPAAFRARPGWALDVVPTTTPVRHRAPRPAIVFSLCVLSIAVALVLGVLGAMHTVTLVAGHPKIFPEASLALAGLAVVVVAATTIDVSWLLSIGLALSIFSGDWHYMHIPVPLDRGVTFVAVAVVVLRPLVDASAPRLKPRRIHALLAVLALYAVCSAVIDGTALQHVALFALLDRLGIEPFLLYLVAPAAFATEAQRRRLLWMLVLVGIYLSITAILEFTAHSLVFPSFIENPNLGIHYGRARGPFLEAGADGLAMFTSAVGCAMLLARRPSTRIRALLWATILLCVLGLLLTLTRQVWLGALAGSVLAALMTPRLRRFIPLGLLTAALLVGGAFVVSSSLQRQVRSRTEDQSSLWDRYNSDSAALRMVEANPLVGVGWGEFPYKSGPYYHVAANYPLTDVSQVHNVVIANAVDLGVIGCLVWLVAVAIAFIGPLTRRGPPSLQPWKIALVAVGVAWFVQLNFAPVSYAYDNYLPWILAGLATVAPVTDPVRTRVRAVAARSPAYA